MVKGSFFALLLYDVAEEIRLEHARQLLGGAGKHRGTALRGPVPAYAGFSHPPAVLCVAPVVLDTGETWSCVVKLYEYGIISVSLELPFESSSDALVTLSSRWIADPGLEARTHAIARAQFDVIRPALVNPYDDWAVEDYYVVHVLEACAADGRQLPAQELIDQYGRKIAQIVRGEALMLAEHEEQEILRNWISYYPTDLLVVGWMAAFVYDSAEGGASALQLLEYANAQLIEFRYYDEVLSKVLAGVYRTLERRRGVLGRWRLAKEAERLNRIRLDVMELTERVDTSIKFLGDMFYARAYRQAAGRIGVTDYRNLVDEKLRIAAELYESMVNEFHHGRAFILEFMVVAILVIELVFLFTGHR